MLFVRHNCGEINNGDHSSYRHGLACLRVRIRAAQPTCWACPSDTGHSGTDTCLFQMRRSININEKRIEFSVVGEARHMNMTIKTYFLLTGVRFPACGPGAPARPSRHRTGSHRYWLYMENTNHTE